LFPSRRTWVRVILCGFALCTQGAVQTVRYGMDFMEIGVGARSFGLGGAYVSMCQDATGIYWNPASLVLAEHPQFHAMHEERFAGLLNWDFAGVNLPRGENLSLGIGFFRMGSDDIPLTRLKDPSRDLGAVYVDETGRRVVNAPYVYRYSDYSETAVILSLSRRMRPSLSFGANVKGIRKAAEGVAAWGIGFDAGLLYQPAPAWRLALRVSDITSTLIIWNTERKELVLPHIRAGASRAFRFGAIDASVACDWRILPGRLPEGLRVGGTTWSFATGVEAAYRQRVALRAGVGQGRFAAGCGLRVSWMGLDYGFSPHSDLGYSHRISLTVDRLDHLAFWR